MHSQVQAIIIRRATIGDLAQVSEIYNEAVVNTLSTFHLYPRSDESQVKWFMSHTDRHPLFVAEQNSLVLGWACLSPYSEREGYQHTVNDSIYVRQEFRRRRIGFDLLNRVVDESVVLGYHSVIGVIARENLASLRLHEKCGFAFRGELKEAGYKFGKWVDVCFYQKIL